MDKFVIEGGAPLHGSIAKSGYKNSALPALEAALLSDETVVLERIPRVRDIRTMERLLVDIGSEVEVDEERVTLNTKKIVFPAAPDGLKGAHVVFDRITVTGTEDILMAAVLADGESIIENAAREPEVVDLADLLVKMGAKIEGEGTSVIRVQGVAKLHGATHEINAD